MSEKEPKPCPTKYVRKAARDARQHMIEADMDMSYLGEMDVDHAECD
jgi:hypothetical protein